MMGFYKSKKCRTWLLAAALLAPSAYLSVFNLAPSSAFAQSGGSIGNISADMAAAATVTKTEILEGRGIQPMIWKGSADALAEAAERYRDIIANGGFPKVPSGGLKKGSKGKKVAILNQRLFMEGYLRKEGIEPKFLELFTTATQDALMRFQRNMGLSPSGKMDGPTLKALNVPAQKRLITILANIERLRAYEQNLGSRYLIVNVPSQQIEAVSDGEVYSRHNAIVGRQERPTPVVMTALSDINFNPYWNAPVSIVEQDIMPKLRTSTAILEEMNMRVFQGFGGPELDPKTVDWRSTDFTKLHFRQEPGEASAMATAKINFPSPFGIYLHDTPEKHLFDHSARFYSSGCVRVQRVDWLLNWILNGQDGIGSAEITALAETLERRDVKLTDPPQLRVAYLTAWPVGRTVAFRHDVYHLDGSGFVTGQPLPVGELTSAGKPFILKPVVRKASAVDALEAEGYGLFSSKRSKKKKSFIVYEEEDDSAALEVDEDLEVPKKKQKTGAKPELEESGASKTNKKPLTVEGQPSAVAKQPVLPVNKEATPTKKVAVKKKKDFPGLFDWETYRKEQKALEAAASKPKKKSVKSGAEKKPTATEKCLPDKDGKLPKDCKPKAADLKKKSPATTAAN